MTRSVADRLTETRRVIETMKVPRPAGIEVPPGPPDRASLRDLVLRRIPPYEFFRAMSTGYGPVSHVRLAGQHVYVVSAPELIWQVFVTDARKTMKGRALQLTRPLLGTGLLTSEGATHLRNRRLVQPAFDHRRVARYADDMVAVARERGDQWRRAGAGAPLQIDVVAQMSDVTLQVVGRSLFGTDLSGEAGEVGRALDDALVNFARGATPLLPALSRIPSPGRRRMFDSVARLDAVVQRLIQRKRQEIEAGNAGTDVLSLLLLARDEQTGAALDDDQLRDETMTLVLAGHETTAMALSWALRDLTMHPPVLAWLREELDRAPQVLSMSDVPDLPRTRSVVAEAMRMHPPAWILGRHACEDLHVGGFTVPAGSTVLASQYAMHRDHRWWPDAERFQPQRWLDADGRFDERNPGVPRGGWFPFGFGTRRCIGEQFAWVEAVLVLATLLREWTIDVIEPLAVEPQAAVTLRPRSRVRARLTPR